jgi:Tol biopolymer transport system component/C-terminal processing protease CtpA/Prc
MFNGILAIFGIEKHIHIEMKRLLTSLTALLAVGIAAIAQEAPLWLRHNQISPDGSKIAFEYKGDLFVVDSEGGVAVQITSNDAYENNPVWTKDGKGIYFLSYREGLADIYYTSPEGGNPKRITDFPGNETPLATTSDGSILFSADIQPDASYMGFPQSRSPQVWMADTTAGMPRLVTSLTMCNASVSSDGTVLYEDYKGYEDALRKHHKSSVTRDIWVCKASSDKFKIGADSGFRKLTSFEGEDREPFFAADGDTFYYLSEQDGKNINVFKSKVSDPSHPVKLTDFDKNPARFLSVANDGTIAFSYNGELYTMKEGQEPRKVDIKVYMDQTESELDKISFRSAASAMDVSQDGKQVAVVVRGDVFVTSADYSTTKRITNTPEQERDVSFSKDGRTLYYASERNGFWGIYRTTLTEKKDKYFTYSVNTKEELFSDEGETCFQPVVSPDGKYVAYLRDRTEIVIKPTSGGAAKSVLPRDINYSYSDGDQAFTWSPDSRYILSGYQADGRWNNQDICLIDIESGEITDLTESGYSDYNPRWVMKGHAMLWQSDKNGYRSHGSWGAEDDVYVMFFDGKTLADFKKGKEEEEIDKILSGKDTEKAEKKAAKDSVKTAEKEPEKLKLDLENRKYRIVKLTRMSGHLGDSYLTDDGSTLYYMDRIPTGNVLYSVDLKKHNEIKVVKTNCFGGIIPAKDGKAIYVFAANGITKISIPSGKSDAITFSADYEFKPKAEREYIFGHVWKQVKEKFYDPDLHGVDWDYYKENYSRFLPYINNNFDFTDMLSEMLGELNGSHTGARFYYRGGETLGRLGIIWDKDYEGDGIKIQEVLPEGVLFTADPEIKAGDMITAIDGTEIKAGKSWFPLLSGKAGKKVTLTLKKGGKEAIMIVTPSSSEETLLYKRWVRRNEEMVAELSGGKVGYVHVEGMDSPSFREVFQNALGKYRTCEALIVDTRHNGGGWLHDDLINFLNGKVYYDYTPRGQYIGSEPFMKWVKPSCVMVGEDNYSDASGFPLAYQTLGIGKLIGAPVPGTMTAVWWEYQVNRSIVFGIPQVGNWSLKDKRYVENHQINPDILVYNDPETLFKGEDKQIEAAVKEMIIEGDASEAKIKAIREEEQAAVKTQNK